VMPRQTAAVLSDSVDHYKFRTADRCCAAQHRRAAQSCRRLHESGAEMKTPRHRAAS
jgi:hypothetical protein